MKAANLNHLWGRLILAELTRLGVTQVYLSPGSRSTPLAIAAAESESVNTTIHFDERGAAFAALGYAKACGRPAALVCTSGTALVNYYPAIVEASMSLTPLIILSADRPLELRNCGAPQTINQVEIFGDYLRRFVDLPAPSEDFAPDMLLESVDQSYRAATGSPAGPVQLNCQFREPLAPLGGLREWSDFLAPVSDWLKSGWPLPATDSSSTSVDQNEVTEVASLLARAKRGVILAGPLPAARKHEAVVRLAEQLKWPVLADISSGLRFGRESESLVAHADLYLRDEQVAATLRPDLVLQFGAVPSSKAVLSFAAESGADYTQISEHLLSQDPLHAVTKRFRAEPNRFAEWLLTSASSSDPEWLTQWRTAEREATKHLAPLRESGPLSEPAVAATICLLALDGSALFLANSMPIRDVDAFAQARPTALTVGSNRGANGIDGTVASGVGFAGGSGCATTILLGDLALLHDLNSLALARDSELPVVVVVLNNNGGGIFHFLPIAKVEQHFERYFGTPHNLDFKQAAQMFSLPYYLPESPAIFESNYAELTASGRSGIIEIKTDREQNAEDHRRLWQDIAG
ncbi:MAG: 2-succinyl-5-enolpyruvyl-6-hydroxy-3-cyclohexene-1-carboxylic-acid synthase, partial [bacterium]